MVGSQGMSSLGNEKAKELLAGGAIGVLNYAEGFWARHSPIGAWPYPVPVDASGGGNSTATGYWQKKHYDPNIPSNADGSNTILIRYAEVLLNFAEATNELLGPTADVYEALNQIRSRAGMPNLPTGLDQDSMRERIRHERRVELAFEGDRFYSIRRWRIAESVMPQDVLGAVNPTDGNNVVASTGRVFDALKDYLWPIPQSVIDLSDEGVIVQNPCW